jgi:16S rRNA U516 pseudouridylate synthase RsuA-like enzyme
MFERVGHTVLALARLRFGPIGLGALPVGGVRPASPAERAALARIVQDARAAKAKEQTSP